MIRVNIGCGPVFHPDWVNLDIAPASPEVRPWDLRRGLPFTDASVDAVYHSHVLEHLEAATGRFLLAECARVLRSGGILRMAVPDSERVARAYLEVLDAPVGVDPVMHDWMRLEMTDQFARSRSGGAMVEFVKNLGPADMAKVSQRLGVELDQMLRFLDRPHRTLAERIRDAGWRRAFDRGRVACIRCIVRALGGRELAAAFDEGAFRASGEVHRCAHDRYSLQRELEACGFHEIVVAHAAESRISDFAESGLEVHDGRVRKPDSLFMEASLP